jgi:catechol 2,3-dioxygenase-like lactoylglutathione lyase family enzyme
MKPKIGLITLGVKDFAKSVKFYSEGLGFPIDSSNENVAFFRLEGTWLSIYPLDKLAEDATVSSEGSGFKGFTLAHNVSSKEKVDEVLNLAEKAGAKILKPGQDVFWGGYSGYFSDPEGYLWEVAWNPFTDLT